MNRGVTSVYKLSNLKLRILFLVHNLGKTRHFEGVIRSLAARGHTVAVAAARKRKPLRPTRALHDEARIEVMTCPTRRVDRWLDIATPLRSARDYLRFLDPRYARSAKLAARAAEYAPPGLPDMLERRPFLRRHWKLAQRLLALAETVLPPDRYFELFLRAERADLLLVTPLVDFGSYQTDYVKAAHRIGIPVAFLPFSWDNLTNRGLIRVAPDRVLVWNDHQRREATELHGMAPSRVVVTGAPRFDEFFAMQPATTREQFCAAIGLPPDRALVLYTCSSNFVAPREVEFVRRWVTELRRSPFPVLRDCGILVRPHPAHRDQWQAVDPSDLAGVAIWRERGDMNADQGLFDSLHHAAAVVGLNTSAMIEAAIVGRPVFTIATDEFAAGQGGTLHYRYLLTEHGGIVSPSDSFDAHCRQLAAGLAGDPHLAERGRRFVEAFVRPRGVDRPATSIMVDEIEGLAGQRKRRVRTPLWHYPVRWSLLATSGRALRRGRHS